MFEHLVKAGLVKQKRYENGLSVFKYTRKVFYDALWNTDPLLLEARGMVLDDEGNKVIWPFTKVFNHYENGAELDLDTIVVAPRKINGFMAAARMYKGELVVSTTGTLDSEFVALARKHIEKLDTARMLPRFTYLFEIVDESDPHIIEEVEGAYLIGARSMQSGLMMTEGGLIWAERYQTIDMVDCIDNLLESLLDKYDVQYDEDFDYDNLDGYADKSVEMHEFLIAYREELLAKNLKSFKFDW